MIIEIPFNSIDYANCVGILFEPPSCGISSPRDIWDQNIIECKNGKAETKKALLGKYRFVFSYWEDDCYGSKKRIISSNEFTIK